jgi:hypothetical protein
VSSSDAPTAGIASTVLATYFPASAADWSAGQEFGQFLSAVVSKQEDKCLVADGFRPVPAPPQYFSPANEEFPDLTAIARDGYFVDPNGIPASPSPTHGMSASQTAAYTAAAEHCGREGGTLFAPVAAIGQGPLGNEWQDELLQIDASPEFQRALQGFASCNQAAGVPATSIAGFLSYVNSQVVPATQSGQSGAASDAASRLAAVFARCLGPAEAVRDALRAKARAAFFDAHAQAISQLRAAATSVVSRLAAEYGVTLGRG